MYQVTIRIHYPLQWGTLVLRTDRNWDQDITPHTIDPGDNRFDFTVETDEPYLYFKPCIRNGDEFVWSAGTNKLAISTDDDPQDFYPNFFSGLNGSVTELLRVPSALLGRDHLLRIYLPAGYDENYLKRYPTIYMHDGTNLFFPEEAFMGQTWEIDENLEMMDSMNIIDQTIVIGIYAANRFEDFTSPGYYQYGDSLVTELKPLVDQYIRTLPDRERTCVMGSSLGGVVSFFLGWQYPHIFKGAACMSSTFSYQDDLIDRVRRESIDSRADLKFYLDSGWPGDNYEVTLGMAHALIERGFNYGREFIHFAFPMSSHNEAAWAARVHLPLQFISGKIHRAEPHTPSHI